jgi:predicted RNase H-like HicB family nuclease
MKFSIVIHEAEEGGFWAEVPALGACYAQGETIEETLEEIRGAIESHLIALRADGKEIPADQGIWVETITVEAPTAA